MKSVWSIRSKNYPNPRDWDSVTGLTNAIFSILTSEKISHRFPPGERILIYILLSYIARGLLEFTSFFHLVSKEFKLHARPRCDETLRFDGILISKTEKKKKRWEQTQMKWRPQDKQRLVENLSKGRRAGWSGETIRTTWSGAIHDRSSAGN